MRIYDLRKTLLYAMMVCAFLALQMSEELSPIVVALFYAGAAVSWFWEAPRVQLQKWAQPWTLLTVGVFVFTVFDIVFTGEFPLIAGMNFVLFLATAKLFQRAEHKDYTQAMALSLLVLATGAVLNDGVSYGVLFAFYVVLATLGLTVQHVNVEVSTYHGDDRNMRIERAILWATTALGILVFAGAATFFFAFPRIGFGFFVQQSRQGLNFTGFSDEVTLGNHGTIPEDQTIALRVVLPDGKTPEQVFGMSMLDVHWRGISLDRYDGRAWSDTDNDEVDVIQYIDGNGYGFSRDAQRTPWAELIADTAQYEVNLEPLIGSDVLFSVGEARGMQLPGTISEVPDTVFARNISMDTTGQISFRSRDRVGVRYTMYSIPPSQNADALSQSRWADDRRSMDLRYPVWSRYLEATGRLNEVGTLDPSTIPYGFTEEQLQAALDPGLTEPMEGRRLRKLVSRYLQLPKGAITPRMAELLARLDQQGATSAYARVNAVLGHLSTLTYTTDLPEPSGPDANLVDEFLFEWERGHCEYFATAMVVLLRAMGIPARMVNGFLGGDYNSVGGYFNVRQANAHSWVEVFFPDQGWVEFDPTPPGWVTSQNRSGVLNQIAMAMDSLQLMWFRWVVEYNLEKQFSVLRDAFQQLNSNDDGSVNEESQREFLENLREWAWKLFRNARSISALVLLALAAGFSFRRRALGRIPWSGFDGAIGSAWLALSVGSWNVWWGRDWIVIGAVLAILIPLTGTAIAWFFRRLLFLEESEGTRRRGRGSVAISHLYASLIRDLEHEVGRIPVSLTPDEFLFQTGSLSPELAAQLRAFLQVYQQSRFGGMELNDAQLREWRRSIRKLSREMRREIRARIKAQRAAG